MSLPGCGAENAAVGKWVDGRGQGLELAGDGTCLPISNSHIPVTCSWQTLSNGQIQVHETIMNTAITFGGRLEDGYLVLYSPNGQPMPRLHRAD